MLVSTAAQVVLLWAALQYEAREARTRNASLKKESGPSNRMKKLTSLPLDGGNDDRRKARVEGDTSVLPPTVEY